MAAPSLAGTVARLCVDLATVQAELRAARAEIRRLRRGPRGPRWSDLASLRRAVAFYCHPDRGGDELTMRRVNALFDALEGRP